MNEREIAYSETSIPFGINHNKIDKLVLDILKEYHALG